MPYSDVVLDHFHNPRNRRVMERPDAVGVAGEPGRGPFMLIYLRVKDGTIVEAAFQTHGCCPSIAAGSWVTERVAGRAPSEAAMIESTELNHALGGLPPSKLHCAVLASDALRRAVASLLTEERKRHSRQEATWQSI